MSPLEATGRPEDQVRASIITPVYNDPRITRAIESVLSQEFDGNLELIVVDGGSTDATLSAIEPYRDRIAHFSSEPDEGIYDAMNKGIRRSTGDVVGILNADDQYADRHVLRTVVSRLSQEDIDGCYGNLRMVDDGGRVVRQWISSPSHSSQLRMGWVPPHPTLFLRRGVYERCGLFDTSYRISADYEFMLRLLRVHDIRLHYVDRILVEMATGGVSTGSVRNIIRGNIEVSRACRRHGMGLGLFTPLAKVTRKVAQIVRARGTSDGDQARERSLFLEGR